MPSIIIVGLQWGDEGKGKIIDLLAEKAHYVVRCQGGNNAGHTVVLNSEEYSFHLLPSGVLYPQTMAVIGGGTVIYPKLLLEEIESLQKKDFDVTKRLKISPYAHLVMPYHELLDDLEDQQREEKAIGTTKKGTGPCYVDKVRRMGICIGDLLSEKIFEKKLKNALLQKNWELEHLYHHPPLQYEAIFSEYIKYGEELKNYVSDTETEVGEAVFRGDVVLFEGAQGTGLDITFGTYPYVTASSTLAAGLCAGAGVGPTKIDHTIGVVKAYATRDGSGPFPTELKENERFPSPTEAREIGAPTGRARRMGWFDSVLVRQAIRLNGVDSIALTKLDILDDIDILKICVGYKVQKKKIAIPPANIEEWEEIEPVYEEFEGWKTSTKDIQNYDELPEKAKLYLERIRELCGIPFSFLSVGPSRNQTISLHEFFS